MYSSYLTLYHRELSAAAETLTANQVVCNNNLVLFTIISFLFMFLL